MGLDQELKGLAFSLYPLSFFLYSPFKDEIVPLNRYLINNVEDTVFFLDLKLLNFNNPFPFPKF